MENDGLPLAYRELVAKVVPMTVYRVLDADEQRIEKVRAVQLEILAQLLSVCRANGLTVFLMYGSLLGYVRNGGFIPGDDDIDVALMREDYDKLLGLSGSFPDGFLLQSPAAEDCFYGGYTKLRKRGTSCIVPQNWYKDCDEGICIDIFPVDFAYADRKKEQKKLRRIRQLQRLLYAKSYGFFASFQDMPLLEWKLYKYAGKLFSRQRLLAAFDRLLAEHDGTGRCRIYTHYTAGAGFSAREKDSSFPAELVGTFLPATFEGLELAIPAGWKELLRLRYGCSFLEMNADGGQMKLRHGFYSLDVPSKVYKKRFSRAGKNIRAGQKVVLVGDAAGMSEFAEQFGGRYRPEALCMTHTVDWPLPEAFGAARQISLHDLKEFSSAEFYVVVTGIFFREAEAMLRDAGVRDYYIFVRNREWLRLANPEDALWELRGRAGRNDG